MGIFRVEKVKDYTTISNYHLRDKNLSLKAKGLLTLILALPEDWNFTIRGLSAICKEGAESIGTALKELEKGGYLVRKRVRGADGRMNDTEYNFYELSEQEESLIEEETTPDLPDFIPEEELPALEEEEPQDMQAGDFVRVTPNTRVYLEIDETAGDDDDGELYDGNFVNEAKCASSLNSRMALSA